MSIKFQKILRWIPLVNLVTVLCALALLIKKRCFKIPVKPVVKVFVYIALLTLPEIFIDHFFAEKWGVIVHYVCAYLQLYVISSFGIEVQKEATKNAKQ